MEKYSEGWQSKASVMAPVCTTTWFLSQGHLVVQNSLLAISCHLKYQAAWRRKEGEDNMSKPSWVSTL